MTNGFSAHHAYQSRSSTFQSFQLKFLSTDTTTLLFKTSAGVLGLLVEAYALGVVLPGTIREIRKPEDTEP